MNIQTRIASHTELRYLPAEIREIEAPHRRVSAIISTEAKDRWGSVIRQSGLHWQSEDLPVLAGHDTGEPIARTTKIAPASVNGVPATMATIQFPDAGVFPESDRAFDQILHGLVRNFSIGFRIEEERQQGRDWLISKAEIVEVSTAAVPGNPAAEVLAVQRQAPAPRVPEGRRIEVLTAPAIVEGRHLMQATLMDFAAIAANETTSRRDVGPAREWGQELDRAMGGAPERGVRMPLNFLLEKRDAATAPGGPGAALATEQLMRNMLDRLVAALREQTYFGALGVPLVTATEQRLVLPSVGAKGTGSAYIARDGDAAPGVNPTFTALPVDPKTIATLKLIPRSMLQYTGGAAEEVIRADMAAEHTEVMQTKFLFGDATANPLEPDGLVKRCTVSGISAVQLMDRDALLAFLGVVENTALSPDLLRWFFPPKLRRTFESTFWVQPLADRKTDERLLMPDADELLDYPFVQSRYLRDGMGVGSNEADLFFGDFSQSYFVSWQSATVMTNPYSSAPGEFRAGGVECLILSDHGHCFRDPARVVWTKYAQVTTALTTTMAATAEAPRNNRR